MRCWFLLAALVSTIPAGRLLAADAATESAKAEVIAAENARTAALTHQDVAALDKLLSDDLTYIHASGRIDNKKTMLEAVKSDQLHYISWTSKEMHVRMFGHTAILDGEYAVKVINRSASPDTLDLNVLFLGVYAKSGSHWRLIAWQTTKDIRP